VTDPNLQLNTITYQKGALVLHMLRGQIGDSAFFRGIREYYRIYRDSSVLSQQFQRVMERASGDTLGWFWRQWLRQGGYPQLQITWRNDQAGQALRLDIRQTQPERWGRYRIPQVPVLLVLTDGRVLRRSFTLSERYAEQTHSIMMNPGDAAVSEVVIDPDGALLLAATTTRQP
jgi:aminopeptidase N